MASVNVAIERQPSEWHAELMTDQAVPRFLFGSNHALHVKDEEFAESARIVLCQGGYNAAHRQNIYLNMYTQTSEPHV